MDRLRIKEDKKARPFKAAISLLAEADRLAKHYGISFNTLVVRLIENAVEEWSVPGMEELARPSDMDEAGEQEKALT